MEAVKPVYLLLICQGFYLGSVGQSWTVPSVISALIGSCVEIPCTYQHGIGTVFMNADTSKPPSPVWYLYATSSYPEILNTKDSSSVLEEYRGRTSLVPGRDCTLRINPVRRGDEGRYYPGIAGDTSINADKKPKSKSAELYVIDAMAVLLHGSRTVTEGEASTIECSADHTCRSSPPAIQWNKPGRVTQKSVEITLGYWREESQLTFIPTYVDDGSDIQCTATYPNGQKTKDSITLNVYYSPKNVTVTIIGMDEVIEGSDVTFQCNSVSNPQPYTYEWYQGKEKSKLQNTGQKIIVRSMKRDMEPYSCAAINTMGRGESALMDIPVLYKGLSIGIIILLAMVGTIFLLLLVYCYWRKRCQKLKSNETGTSPDATYTDLVRRNIESEYEQYKPVNPKHIIPIPEGHGGADTEYENVIFK